MANFRKKVFLFFIISLSIALLLQWVIDTGLKKSNYCSDYKEWYDITNSKINSDIIIQGSSRAKLQISPAELEKSFHLTIYNLGMPGSYFPLQNYRFSVYLKYNKKPKFIIQTVDVGMFSNPRISFNYEQYIPYLNKGFIKRFGHNSVFNVKDFYIPLYKYTHQLGLVDAGLTNFFNKSIKDNGTYKGFSDYDLHYDAKPLEKLIRENPKGFRTTFDTSVYNEFVNYIKYCKSQNIHLILVNTPSLESYQKILLNEHNGLQLFETLSRKYQINFLNYSNDTLCRDTSMFFDFYHLNRNGVKVFNKHLIHDLYPIVHPNSKY